MPSNIIEHANALKATTPETLTLAEIEAILEALMVLLPGIIQIISTFAAKEPAAQG